MNTGFRGLLLCSAVFVTISLSVSDAAAQTGQAAVTPAPDPATGQAPAAPSGAQQTYDQVVIQQLMKIESLSRLIGGGISQLYSAQAGTKTLPNYDNPAETTGQGGPGLQAMANAALAGSPTGPADVTNALNALRTPYSLAKAFALQTDTALGNQLAALTAAQGAIAASTAEASYGRANASMTRLDSYITSLQSSADMKTSVDLNTRVMIEVAQQLNESLRTQAAMTSAVASYFMIIGAEAANNTVSLPDLTNFNR